MTYQTQIASDVIRDGLGIELIDKSGNVVAEVFRCDSDKTLTVSTFGEAVPLDAMEQLIQFARRELPPFEDGTPLERATNLGLFMGRSK